MGGYIEGVIRQRLRDKGTPQYNLPKCRDLKRVGERFLGPRLGC